MELSLILSIEFLLEWIIMTTYQWVLGVVVGSDGRVVADVGVDSGIGVKSEFVFFFSSE